MDQQHETVRRFDHCPWLFAGEAGEAERAAQHERQARIDGDVGIGERCYVAESAAVFPDWLRLGDDSYIAAHAYVTGEVTAGSDCTLNPYTTVRGKVTLGNAVRIGAHTSLLGFNHSMAPDRPVFRQPQTSRGITIGDDVWIGSHVVVVDGVTVGDHCVIGAGAVVTKDLPAWTVAAGNPARPLRDRREPRSQGPVDGVQRDGTQLPAYTPASSPATPTPIPPDPLARFADTVRAQAPDLIARCWNGDHYTDRPGTAPTLRAHCDAVEIADLLLARVPDQLTPEEHVKRLAGAQDPATGLVPELGGPVTAPEADGFVGGGAELYHILSVGYALDLLGASFPQPVRGVQEMTASQLTARLDGLTWKDEAWGAGAWIDAWATAAHWNRRDHTGLRPGTLEALCGWLLTRADPWTGMWGAPSPTDGRLQVVNGYYRLTRGSFAQFGLPVPHAERVVDAVLDHSRDPRHFGAARDNACNVLDVAHPLWLTTRQLGTSAHRLPEVHVWAERQLALILPRWRDGEGFAFGPTNPEPGLQGTEMWLAIVWYLADLLGRADSLGYRPRGVHRPEPAGAPR
ncbi:acyltransferase [Streptomyces roseirectus]|uniref:acyltransferase n=1 Tax=Streptomyces roseirectus TaxID=2768066 RepID=UPI001FE549F2|nr:acyltransferase [Streptomyces roseirectus]